MIFIKKSKPIDLIYVEGPGNIVESLKRWHIKENFSVHTSLNFSGQLFDFCKNNNLKTLAVSSGTEAKGRVEFESFSAFSKPKIMINGSLGYHFSQTLYGLYLIGLCLRYRPKYLHITSGVTHWFVLAPIKLIGVKIFPQFHNTFWAKGFLPSGKIKLLLLKLDAWFLKYIAAGATCCSLEIKRQIEEITKHKNCPTYVFKPQFYRNTVKVFRLISY